MRNLVKIMAVLFGGWITLACTSQDDEASQSGAEGGNGTLGGSSSSSETGGSSSSSETGGTTASSSAGDVTEVRSDLAPVTSPDITDTEYASFIEDSNTFGLELQQELVNSQSLAAKNNVFSPTSVELALAMTYGAAVGDTAAEMKTVLHDNLDSQKYHAASNRLMRELDSRNYSYTDDYDYTWRIELSPANSLWTDESVELNSDYLDLLSQQYDTGMKVVDFQQQPEPARIAINDWVETKTNDKIQELLVEGDVTSDTRFVIVNALYFYGSWMTPFDKTATATETFHALDGDVDASMMHDTNYFMYQSTSSVEVLKLPYTNGDLWMTLVLPSEGQFEATRAQVSWDWLSNLTTGWTSTYVDLSLPKFTIETAQLQLAPGLKALGMTTAFTEAADFTGMTALRPLFLSAVIQKAFIGVNEDGTEAAAATAVVGDTSSIPPTPVAVTFDRPFLFFIQDSSGLVLFSGQVTDPSQ